MRFIRPEQHTTIWLVVKLGHHLVDFYADPDLQNVTQSRLAQIYRLYDLFNIQIDQILRNEYYSKRIIFQIGIEYSNILSTLNLRFCYFFCLHQMKLFAIKLIITFAYQVLVQYAFIISRKGRQYVCIYTYRQLHQGKALKPKL